MFGFRIIFTALLILLQMLVYFTFIRYLKTTKIYKPSFRWYALIPFLVFNVPFFIISWTIGRSFNPPQWFIYAGMYPFYAWHGVTFLIAVWLLVGKIIKYVFMLPVLVLKMFRPLREKIHELKSRKTVQTIDLSRRRFVRTATFAFSAYSFYAATYGIARSTKYEITEQEIQLANLPPELKGLTITLLSDIHAGQYMKEDDMREYADLVNEIGSDIICIPGDFVNFQSEDAKNVASAFRDLKAKYGVYGSLGNHDFFQDPELVAKVIVNESPVRMLRNSHEVINVNGKQLVMLGVDDTRSGFSTDSPAILQHIDKTHKATLAQVPQYENLPKILLCHKPYAFDEMTKYGFGLVLAGHTHGGQVVPIKLGSFNLSIAGFVSKYIAGLYSAGNSHMYVSRGIGTVALPIRLNCPPEITKITLV
jgi:predicted MPP superfamily phosphohydrolase